MGTMSAEEFSVRESLLVNRMWGRGSTATYQNPRGPSLSTSSAVAPLWSTQIKVSHAYFVSFSDAKNRQMEEINYMTIRSTQPSDLLALPMVTITTGSCDSTLWPRACLHGQSYPILCNPRTVVCQASLCMGLPRQEYWSGFPFLFQGIFPTKGLNQYPLHWLADSLSLSHLGACGLIINQSENWPGADYVPHTTPSLFGLWRCFPETPGGVSGGFLSISPAFFSDGPVINFSLFQTPTSQFVWLHCSVGSGTCLQQQGLYQNF